MLETSARGGLRDDDFLVMLTCFPFSDSKTSVDQTDSEKTSEDVPASS